MRYVTHYNVSFVAPDDPVLGNVAHDLYLYPDADIASVAYHKDFLDRMQGVPYGAEVAALGFEPRAALPAPTGRTATLQLSPHLSNTKIVQPSNAPNEPLCYTSQVHKRDKHNPEE